MQQLNYTKHATHRMQQRGIRRHQVERLIDLADLYIPVGRALGAIRISRPAIAEAVADGWLCRAEAERLKRRAVLIADDGEIVTVAHLYGRKSASYTRRERRNHWGQK